MRKIIRKGILVGLQYNNPFYEHGITYHNYVLRFRTLYERSVLWNEILKSDIPDNLFKLGIKNCRRGKWFIRKKGRKFYILPRRNRVFMSEYQFRGYLYNKIYLTIPEDYLFDFNKKFKKVLERAKMILGNPNYKTTKSKCKLRYCFKAYIEDNLFI